MRKLLKYMSGYRKECFLGPFLKILEATLELLVPYVILDMVDVGIKNGDKGYIVTRMLILVLMGVGGLVFTVLAQYFSAKASCGFTARVREALFSHIQSLSYKELDNIGKSTMITRLTSDMNQVQNGLNLTLRLFLRSPFIVFGAMIMAFTVDTSAAMVFVVAIPVLAVFVFGIMLVSIPLFKRVQKRLDTVLRRSRENLIGVRMLRALGKEKQEITEFDESNAELTDAQNLVGRISALLNPLTYILINIAIALLIYKGAVKVEYGVLTQGAVLALYNYMSQILTELVKLANLIINITKSIACANRIQAVFEIKNSQITEEENASGNDDCAVEFRNVTLRYGKGNASLKNISFSVMRGQTVGIIGGTGSGKTSLVNLIGRYYDCTEGSVFVFGHNVKSLPIKELRSHIGVVPQGAALFRGSIMSNLKFGNKNADEDEIWNALRISQAEEFVSERDGKLDAYVEQSGKNLSGGQRQRLTIARAILRDPEILILDDSSSALDYATDLALRRSIKDMDGDKTVFIVSQRASTVRHADVIIVLDDGELVGIGTHDELANTCRIYKEICDSQMKNA